MAGEGDAYHANGHASEPDPGQQSLLSWAEFMAEEPVKPKGRGREAQPRNAYQFGWVLCLEQEPVGAVRWSFAPNGTATAVCTMAALDKPMCESSFSVRETGAHCRSRTFV